MPQKKHKFNPPLSASTSLARVAPPATPDFCNPLPTTINWDRTNAQTGGLLDWSMDELQNYWKPEVQSVVRAVRSKLTCDQAVVIFVARRYVLLPRLISESIQTQAQLCCLPACASKMERPLTSEPRVCDISRLYWTRGGRKAGGGVSSNFESHPRYLVAQDLDQ